MKNLAICFSGAIRSFHLCHMSIKEMIIEPLKTKYKVYLFGHFWTMKQDKNEFDITYQMKWKKDSESVYQLIKDFGFNEYIIEEYNGEQETMIITGLGLASENPDENKASKKPFVADRILESYQAIANEEQRLQYVNYAVNCMGMYYKIMKCNQLKNEWAIRNKIRFDYSIRMRPDFLWNEPIPIDIFDKINDKDIILVYDKYCTRANWQGNDKFFGGSDVMMNSYTNIYKDFEYFFNKGIRIEGQELAQAMIIKLELKIVFFGREETYDKCVGTLYRRLERALAMQDKKRESIIKSKKTLIQ